MVNCVVWGSYYADLNPNFTYNRSTVKISDLGCQTSRKSEEVMTSIQPLRSGQGNSDHQQDAFLLVTSSDTSHARWPRIS